MSSGPSSTSSAVPLAKPVRDTPTVRVVVSHPGTCAASRCSSATSSRLNIFRDRHLIDPTSSMRALSTLCAVPTRSTCTELSRVRYSGRAVRFRHELARVAVERAVPQTRRPELHRAVLRYLAGQSWADASRLAYHAEQAGDDEALVAHAPVAAAQAARLGAHREAAAHYRRVVEHVHLLEPRDRAELLERYAGEAMPIGDQEATLAATEEAAAIWLGLGEVTRAGQVTARRSSVFWNLGRLDEARAAVRDGLALLEPLPPGAAHVQAYMRAAHLHMSERECKDAIVLAERACGLAERLGDPELRAFTTYALGVAQWFVTPEQAEATMVRSLELSREIGHDALVGQNLMNLGSGAGDVRHYATAERWLREGIAWFDPRDELLGRAYCVAWLARIALEQGRWSQATALLAQVPDDAPYNSRVTALNVLGRLRARRGDPGAHEPLDEARELLTSDGHLQFRWPVITSLAESAWLAGELDRVVDRGYLTIAPTAAARGWDIAWLRRWLRDPSRPPAHAEWTLIPDFKEAISLVQEGAGTMLVTGSFHTVGDVMQALGMGV
jgi:tetratricopeptide (TPR) repeat protein